MVNGKWVLREKQLRGGASSIPDVSIPFFILLPSGLKQLSQRKKGGIKGSILERALYVIGRHVLSDSEILEAIKILILTPQR